MSPALSRYRAAASLSEVSSLTVVGKLHSEVPECVLECGCVLEFVWAVVTPLLLLSLSPCPSLPLFFSLPPSRVEPEQPGRSIPRSVAREPPLTSLPCLTRHRSKSSRRLEQLTHVALIYAHTSITMYRYELHTHTVMTLLSQTPPFVAQTCEHYC